MKSIDINLPLLLWAISWNIPELAQVAAERTALMVSEELPGILAHWQRLPRKRGAGIRTKAAYDVMNQFELDTVRKLVGDDESS
jgi:hypothetical protein